MPLLEHVYSVLVVSAFEKFNTSLTAMLPEAEFSPVDFTGTVGEAQRRLTERSYDLLVVNTPLPDDFGRRFAIDACQNRKTVCMLLVKNEIYGENYEKVLTSGVLIMRKPCSYSMMQQAFDWMRIMCERLRGLEKKTVSLEDKMTEIRIVNRAKWALIESLKMTEADAHRYIEKQAMDCCVTRREIAEGILRTYKA